MSEVHDPNAKLRECGTCFACCKFLGITALSKYPNQACKHLDGSNPYHRCTIYAQRPKACETYSCAWREGLGTDLMRPDLSGVLVSIYGPPDVDHLAATLAITDFARAGTISEGNLALLVKALLDANFDDLRVVDYDSRRVIHFLNGFIRGGKLIAPDKRDSDRYESLNFEAYDPPIGRYERKELAP